MANFNRSIKSDLWMTIDFRNLTSDEKVVYLFLHTADITSDSSVFFCPISDLSSGCNISKKKTMNILKKFDIFLYICYYKTEGNKRFKEVKNEKTANTLICFRTYVRIARQLRQANHGKSAG